MLGTPGWQGCQPGKAGPPPPTPLTRSTSAHYSRAAPCALPPATAVCRRGAAPAHIFHGGHVGLSAGPGHGLWGECLSGYSEAALLLAPLVLAAMPPHGRHVAVLPGGPSSGCRPGFAAEQLAQHCCKVPAALLCPLPCHVLPFYASPAAPASLPCCLGPQVNAITHLGQPALLYLCPLTLGSVALVGAQRKDLKRLWSFTDTTASSGSKPQQQPAGGSQQ